MKHHLNTLFVTTPRAYLRKEGEAILVRIGDEKRLRSPLLHLGSVVAFGSVGASPALLGACARAGISVSFLTEHGRFLAQVTGGVSGNVVLRRHQYRTADDPSAALAIAKPIVLAKIANSRGVMMRCVRDHPAAPGRPSLEQAALRLANVLDDVEQAATLDALRGLEGDAARSYFGVFNGLITAADSGFAMNGRSRRPPLDPLNALLSFLYTLVALDARAACETVGLDPQVGFLHAERPGRPSLALDLMEELRSFLADRVALSLINRRQIATGDFVQQPAGGFIMNDDARKTVLVAYQKRKQETILHPFLNETTTIGLLLHLQARLLARRLRGELDSYPPFLSK